MHEDVRALHKFFADLKDGRPLARLAGNAKDNQGKLAAALGVLSSGGWSGEALPKRCTGR